MRGLAVYVNVNYDGLEQSSSLSESLHESQRAPIAVSLGRPAARARPRAAGGRRRQMDPHAAAFRAGSHQPEIGRASCRERGCQSVLISVVAVSLKKKKKK